MKELLSYPEIAGTLLRERLPEAVVKCLTNKPPKLVSGSFMDNLIQVYCYDEPTPRRIIHEVRSEEEETMMSQFAQDIERAVRRYPARSARAVQG